MLLVLTNQCPSTEFAGLFLQRSPQVAHGVQVRTLGRPFPNWPDLDIPLPLLMCVYDHCPVGTPNWARDSTSWLMTSCFSEEFGHNPPSPLFPGQPERLHTIMASPPHLTVGTMFLGLKVKAPWL